MGSGGIILGIEVSNPGADDARLAPELGPGVAIGRTHEAGVDVLGVEPVRPGMRGGNDDDLMPAIDRLFRRLDLSPRTCGLKRVAVSVGPGGYTSVRVACAAGKMIAEGTGARCVSVVSARIALESLEAKLRSQPVCVLLASKGESCYAQEFSDRQAVGDGRLVTEAEVAAIVARGVRVFVGDRFVHEKIRRVITEAGGHMFEPVFSAAACVRLGSTLETIDAAHLNPLYPREPDAVTLWRARKSG